MDMFHLMKCSTIIVNMCGDLMHRKVHCSTRRAPNMMHAFHFTHVVHGNSIIHDIPVIHVNLGIHGFHA